jgi:hypothetical protein
MRLVRRNVGKGEALEEEDVGPELDEIEQDDCQPNTDDAGADRQRTEKQ